jgi:hypothetical protein
VLAAPTRPSPTRRSSGCSAAATPSPSPTPSGRPSPPVSGPRPGGAPGRATRPGPPDERTVNRHSTRRAHDQACGKQATGRSAWLGATAQLRHESAFVWTSDPPYAWRLVAPGVAVRSVPYALQVPEAIDACAQTSRSPGSAGATIGPVMTSVAHTYGQGCGDVRSARSAGVSRTGTRLRSGRMPSSPTGIAGHRRRAGL